MNKDINEKISRFLDDELSYSEMENLLVTVKSRPELKNKISRYQMASHAFKTDDVVFAKNSFLDEINKQLEQEPHHFLPNRLVKKRQRKEQSYFWQKASLAAAASIAMVAVIFSMQMGQQNTTVAPEAVFMAQKQVVDAPPVHLQAQVKLTQHQRLKAYLQAHSDDLYTHGSLNYQPYARVASFGQE